MKKLLYLAIALCVSHGVLAYSKIVREDHFHNTTIKGIVASGVTGNYIVSKYGGDSIVVRISLECKDEKAYTSFMVKYTVTVANNSGTLSLRTDKVPAAAGLVIYELFIPDNLSLEITSEKSNVSLKDLHLNARIKVDDGVLFADNVSGTLAASTDKMDMDIKCSGLNSTISARNAKLVYTGKGGKLTLINSAGTSRIALGGAMEIDAQSTSGDLFVLIPKTLDCNIQATTIKRSITLNMEDVLMKGNITPNGIKVALGKGGTEMKFNTQNGELTLSNVAMLSK